ncbi:MAG: two-component regulator propeller domain-containing protein [Balneolaceae bacterium]|nr:two-component regulator propeller domain-containing protein [Balneolaceae bacterium]
MNLQKKTSYQLILVCLFLAIFTFEITRAQTINPQFISISDGLASTQVQAIHQDQYGLLWIGTTNGLQKYDGITFKTYKTESGQPNSLIDNDVWGLEENENGDLWIATRNGISKYNRNTDTFNNYDFNEEFELATFDGGWVFNLFKDSQNRLWATTIFAGILLFNPTSDQWEMPEYEFEDSEDTNLRDFILAITEDPSGTIWVGTRARGLYSLAPGDSAFKKAPVSSSTPVDFTENPNHISYLYADSTNTLWITTRTGIYKYNPESGVVKTIKEYNYGAGLSTNNWNNIRPDSKGNIWITNNFRGILRFDGISDQYQEVVISGSTQFSDGGWNIILTDFKIDNSGIFWFGTISRGLLKYDPINNPFKHYAHLENSETNLDGNGTFSLLKSEVDPGILYVGTRGGWLNILDRETQTFNQVTFTAVNDLYGGSVRSIAENDDGSLWLGTWGDGLIRTDSNYQETERYTYEPGSFTGLSNDQVRVLKKHSNGDLWIGTNAGLHVLQSETGQIQRIQSLMSRIYPEQLYKLTNNFLANDPKIAGIKRVSDYQDLSESIEIETPGEYLVIAVGEGTDGAMYDYGWIENEEGDTLWTANKIDNSFHAGGALKNRIIIEKLTLEEGTVNLRYFSDDSHSYDLWNEPAPSYTNLWGIALVKIDDYEQHGEINQFLQESGSEIYITSNSIQDIQLDGDIVWIAGGNSGLEKIDTSTNSVDTYRFDLDNSNSISSNSIYGIYQQPDGVLWITTNEGLNRFDPQTEIFTHFTEEDGLPTNFTESVLPGENGGLWISTQSGLSQMIVSESLGRTTFINYDASDGLGGENYIGLVAAKTDDGTYYFGGEHGLNEFTNIEANLVAPSMFISDLKISNKSVLEMGEDSPIDGSFFNAENIELSHTQNDLSFDFTALHFANPGKNQYAHMLEGFDEDWIYDNRNFASYTNLEPGNYTFRVRGSNSDGIWNEDGKSLSISIAPPWWKTLWAYSFYIILLIGGFITVDRVQRKRLMRKQLERARQKELKHAKEIEKAYENLKAAQEQLVQQEKLASLGQLTAGIAHEIKNPLNFVNNFSDLSIELVEEAREEVKTQKAKVKRNIPSPEGEGQGEGDQGSETDLILDILDDIEANLRKIHEHGTRADGIVKSMLQHSRGGSGDMVPTDLNAMIQEYANLAFHGMRAGKNPINVDIELDLDKNIGEVKMIGEDFSRVILNLCNNAFDAMKEKALSPSPSPRGRGVPEGRGEGEYSPKLTVRTHQKNQTVTIEIVDNGPGIPDAIKDKILQPFFTTKKGTAGTGLGLSITNDIIKAHGGRMKIKSSPGEGSVFSIYLELKD